MMIVRYPSVVKKSAHPSPWNAAREMVGAIADLNIIWYVLLSIPAAAHIDLTFALTLDMAELRAGGVFPASPVAKSRSRSGSVGLRAGPLASPGLPSSWEDEGECGISGIVLIDSGVFTQFHPHQAIQKAFFPPSDDRNTTRTKNDNRKDAEEEEEMSNNHAWRCRTNRQNQRQRSHLRSRPRNLSQIGPS